MKYGIVVIGYKKTDSLKRLLNRLNEAYYHGDSVLLIISLDNSGSNDVAAIAHAYEWKHGEKKIIHQKKRLGLKEHVLKCGDYMDEYNLDAEVIFEDDVYPAKGFYDYMIQAVPFYITDESVAGISLYTHKWYSYGDKIFEPAQSGDDVFFMKYAISWGQIWCREKWKAFKKWYDLNKDFVLDDIRVPLNVKMWPETSWLKYHIAYCCIENKYFVMPYVGLATMFGDKGTHMEKETSMYQVCLMNTCKKYSFVKCDNSLVRYDQWFERENDKIVFDIYGTKPLDILLDNRKKFICSTKEYPYRLKKAFSLSLKPHEENIFNEISGEDIFLYDFSQVDNRRKAHTEIKIHEYYNMLSRSKFWYIKYGLVQGLKKVFRIYR